MLLEYPNFMKYSNEERKQSPLKTFLFDIGTLIYLINLSSIPGKVQYSQLQMLDIFAGTGTETGTEVRVRNKF